MMPFSFHGLGTTAILLMLAIAMAGQALRYLKEHHFNRHRHDH